jgi:hypothetical protein
MHGSPQDGWTLVNWAGLAIAVTTPGTPADTA